MKIKSLKIICLMLAVGVISYFSACSDLRLSTGSAETSDTPQSSVIDRDIILVNTYENYAWGWDSYGWYIDSDGYKHEFNFSEDENITEDDVDSMDKILDLLENGYAADNKSKGISKSKAEKYYGYLKNIKNFKFDEEYSNGFDMGETTLCGVVTDENGGRVIIPIVQYGDWDCRNTDEYAVKIAEGMGITSEDNMYHGLFEIN